MYGVGSSLIPRTIVVFGILRARVYGILEIVILVFWLIRAEPEYLVIFIVAALYGGSKDLRKLEAVARRLYFHLSTRLPPPLTGVSGFPFARINRFQAPIAASV